ncbi:MAG: SpoIIE family protein phosphatase [Bacteroidetes bacterium]|jgi:sigma-B regulation protein RsbU (phosphoserine phosphatase)|nr:SpoIIE family protein phosphatase [Bacteroidota bacterium]
MSNVEKLQAENRQLQLAINELKILNDVATTISSVQTVDEIINQIVMKCIKHMGVEEGTVNLLERNTEGENFHTMVRHRDTSGVKVPFRMDTGLKGWMLKNRTSFLSNDIRNDNRFQFLSDDEYPFESILCVPLIVKGEMIGYLAVFNKREGNFTDEDRRLLSIIGSQSAQIIENARLLEEEKMLISLQEELSMASEIQRKLLPDVPPDIPGYQLYATNIPAKSVGGDYYDFVPLSDDRLAFCLGDITGKGMPAAMLMSNLQATFRSQVLVNDDCSICISRTNKLLFRSTESTKFATMIYGALDPKTGKVKYTNGGHDCPIHFKKDVDPTELESTGLILGILEDSEYSQESIQLESGDLLMIFSDGVTEAMDPDMEMFGTKRLKKLVQKNIDKPVTEVASIILDGIKNHAGDTTQSDDITLMLIKKE